MHQFLTFANGKGVQAGNCIRRFYLPPPMLVLSVIEINVSFMAPS
jgi:hypothetical protein